MKPSDGLTSARDKIFDVQDLDIVNLIIDHLPNSYDRINFFEHFMPITCWSHSSFKPTARSQALHLSAANYSCTPTATASQHGILRRTQKYAAKSCVGTWTRQIQNIKLGLDGFCASYTHGDGMCRRGESGTITVPAVTV
ncbi:hypothetical protein TI39_contig623g00013 [Zymoseptoria brevis]|uniref:Uncharacterized protein n=1 Tax=Zymoseptoria brevis TaxID=1047168 RepID=A0A0F4GGG0_9PEZI|nr:hypothetical protein TI39_contig623g00013 [Zymoseptoria brevis]